jgi:hypothetical protein
MALNCCLPNRLCSHWFLVFYTSFLVSGIHLGPETISLINCRQLRICLEEVLSPTKGLICSCMLVAARPHRFIPVQSQSYPPTDGQSANVSWYQTTIWNPRSIFRSLPWKLYLGSFGDCCYGAPSKTRGRVCNLQFPLDLTSSVFLGSESRGNHIFYCLTF